MKLLHSFALLSAAILTGACTSSEREAPGLPAPEPGSTDVVLQKQGAREDLTAYVFRLDGDAYRLDRVLSDGWSADGTLRVYLPDGSYRFLFAEGGGSTLQPVPAPLDGAAWEEVCFERKTDPARPDTWLPTGELFLQKPDEARREYLLAGTRLTVPAKLTRAVCEVVLNLKRGYPKPQGGYTEVPYTTPHTVLDQIDRVALTVTGSALRVGIGGGSGTAEVHAELSASQAVLSDDGFARITGPMLIPPADGTDVGLHLAVTPTENASIAPAELDLKGPCVRNQRLEVTLWITSAYPTIGVEVDLTPITDEQAGDSGIWE